MFKPAIEHLAASIIVAHNHPSGGEDASEDDIEITDRIKKAADILGLEFVFHIIITEDTNVGLESIGIDVTEGDEIEASVIEDPDGMINLIITPTANINTICHESFHIANTILTKAGLTLSDSSEEAYAYLIGWVSDKINKVIKKANG